jgi:sialic acid synthase SpsE
MIEVTFGKKKVGADELFFTVEEGMANLGEIEKAKNMIDWVARTGADAIEFQLVIASDLCIEGNPGFDFCTNCEKLNVHIPDLILHAKNNGLEFLATPLSPKLVEPLAKAGCTGFNINASDINNPKIIDQVVDSGLPFFLSTLLATEEEIKWAVDRIEKRRAASFVILHGQHTMMSSEGSVKPFQTALAYIQSLKSAYGIPVGFIDHTSQIWMPAVAVAAGANSVSKHMAISRSEKGPDWQVCLEPEEMKNSISWAREIRQGMACAAKKLAAGEDADRKKMRRSIVASRFLEAGKMICWEDIDFKRPGVGIEPSKYGDVIGKTLTCDVKMNELFQPGYFRRENT